jgi:muconolactone delta-isomerase
MEQPTNESRGERQNKGEVSDMDQSAMDQRVGRSYAQVEAQRKARGESVAYILQTSGIGKAHWLNMGAWLTLSWMLDDDPMPLRERLENAAVVRE